MVASFSASTTTPLHHRHHHQSAKKDALQQTSKVHKKWRKDKSETQQQNRGKKKTKKAQQRRLCMRLPGVTIIADSAVETAIQCVESSFLWAERSGAEELMEWLALVEFPPAYEAQRERQREAK